MSKLVHVRAADVCELIGLPAEEVTLSKGELTLDCTTRLVKEGKCVEAIRMFSRAIEGSLSVSWAMRCLQKLRGAGREADEDKAIQAVNSWLVEPTEGNRRACYLAAQQVGFDNARGCLAMAAFATGDNIAPENVPPVPPPLGFSAHMVAGALMLAIAEHAPSEAAKAYEMCIVEGRELVES